MDQLRAAHLSVLKELDGKDAKGNPMELDDPRIPDLLKRGWELAGAYAALYIEYNPDPSKHTLKSIFDGFPSSLNGTGPEYTFRGSAVQIGPSIYVVEASYGVEFRTGAFMVVARNENGHFQKLWDIKELAAQHYPQRDEIGRWVYLVSRAYYNGPLDVQRILRLPPAANGHARFLVDAYQGADGGTTLNQLSIWEWEGAKAKPLLVDLYQNSWDDEGFHLAGRTLRISTKEELKMLFSCGMCSEPRGLWTVRITPNGVQDLGHRFLKPEYQWADELLTRVNKGTDATSLANPKVLEALKTKISDLRAIDSQVEGLELEPTESPWGMLSLCRVLRRGKVGAFVLVVDEGELRFTYELRNGRPYFTNVKID